MKGMKLEIVGCARCGGRHSNLLFKPLTRPAKDFAHWAACPRTAQPIIMWIETNNK
jgi:hypothetical protein